MMRARRALLYMPGSDWPKIEKAAGLQVDSICMDLEDGVDLSQKEAARENIVRALKQLDFGTKERLVRINPIASGLEAADLSAVLPARPDGILLPKVASQKDLNKLFASITNYDIPILAQIESAQGLVNIKEIASAGGPLEGLIFGAEDYAADVGAKRSASAQEVLFARSSVVAHAAANGLQAIDMLLTDFKDAAGLQKLAEQGAQLGFDGMQIIHPDQIAIVQKEFSPSSDELERAEKIIAAFKIAQSEGKSVFAMEGKMVDMPMIKAAERVLARK